MKRFEILPLGIGSYFTRRLYNTNFLLYLGEKIVAVDCPGPYRRMLSEGTRKAGNELDYADIEDVIITHLHGDHSNGLEELLFYRYYVLKKRTRIFTSPEAAADLWSEKLAASMKWKSVEDCTGVPGYGPEEFYQVTPWPFGGTFELHGAKFETRKTKHPVPTFGFRCTFEGRTFGYSSDTAFDPEYIAWLAADAALIIHECNLPLHTPYDKLQTIDPEIQRRMHLIHVEDDFETGALGIPIVEQGMPLSL